MTMCSKQEFIVGCIGLVVIPVGIITILATLALAEDYPTEFGIMWGILMLIGMYATAYCAGRDSVRRRDND